MKHESTDKLWTMDIYTGWTCDEPPTQHCLGGCNSCGSQPRMYQHWAVEAWYIHQEPILDIVITATESSLYPTRVMVLVWIAPYPRLSHWRYWKAYTTAVPTSSEHEHFSSRSWAINPSFTTLCATVSKTLLCVYIMNAGSHWTGCIALTAETHSCQKQVLARKSHYKP